MLIKNSKITFPLKGDAPNKSLLDITKVKSSPGVIIELRKPRIKSNLKNIKDYGKPFDIGRLLFTGISKR